MASLLPTRCVPIALRGVAAAFSLIACVSTDDNRLYLHARGNNGSLLPPPVSESFLVRSLCRQTFASLPNPNSTFQLERDFDGFTVLHFQRPLGFRPPGEDVVYLVESDGRHVKAVTCDAVLLWRVNPFDDAALQPYRLEEPRIVTIGPSHSSSPFQLHTFVAIAYDSSQFGVLHPETGFFTFLGQD